MFKIAHISDIHLSPLPQPTLRQLASKRITGYVNWKRNRKHALDGNYLENLLADMAGNKPDHIVVSGDLINLALPQEFENAARFLESLAEPEKVSAICGNHDAYVKGALETAQKKWRPYMSGDADTTQTPVEFPYLRIRGDIAIIGCNSAEATAPFMATGYFRQSQAERLAKFLDETRNLCRVICIHHPPIEGATRWYKRLIGGDLFRRIVSEHGAELVLHGHTHLASTNRIEGPHGLIPVIGVPAAGNVEGQNKPAGRYNLFSIRKAGSEWSILHQAYGYETASSSGVLLEERTHVVSLRNRVAS
ncbi:MAG: metallophosphoesterase family protein [Rhizobiaceae bacterium]